MAYIGSTEYLIEVAKGNIAGASIIHKFGANFALGGNYAPVTIGGIYQTPQVAGAVTLRVKAGNTNDTAAGSGAREITIQGLDATGALQTASVATAGTSASANFTGTWLRVFRVWVSASGTYASSIAGSHNSAIVIESTAPTNYATIDATSFPKGQSQIGAYTVPLGFTAYLLDYASTVDSTKSVDFIFFKRENILETAAPYTAMRTVFQNRGQENSFTRRFLEPIKFEALTDIGVMGKGSGTPEVTVDFNLLLIAD